MLGIGWTEMLVIGVVALIVIGPKDLPVVMRRVGQFAAQIRRMGTEFQREINKTTGLNEVKNLRDSLTAPLKQTAAEIRKEFNAVTAAGTTQPSGIIKPADPKAESVVDEIHAAAGLVPPASKAEALTGVSAPALMTGPAVDDKTDDLPRPTLVKAKRPAKLTPVAESKVVRTPLAPVEPLHAASSGNKAPEPSPAPPETAMPATKRAARPRKPPVPAEVLPTPAPQPEPLNDVAEAGPAKKPVRKAPAKAEKTP